MSYYGKIAKDQAAKIKSLNVVIDQLRFDLQAAKTELERNRAINIELKGEGNDLKDIWKELYAYIALKDCNGFSEKITDKMRDLEGLIKAKPTFNHNYSECENEDCEQCEWAVNNGFVYACSNCHDPIQSSKEFVFNNSSNEPICINCNEIQGAKLNKQVGEK